MRQTPSAGADGVERRAGAVSPWDAVLGYCPQPSALVPREFWRAKAARNSAVALGDVAASANRRNTGRASRC